VPNLVIHFFSIEEIYFVVIYLSGGPFITSKGRKRNSNLSEDVKDIDFLMVLERLYRNYILLPASFFSNKKFVSRNKTNYDITEFASHRK
jgi:hypothetical protein